MLVEAGDDRSSFNGASDNGSPTNSTMAMQGQGVVLETQLLSCSTKGRSQGDSRALVTAANIYTPPVAHPVVICYS